MLALRIALPQVCPTPARAMSDAARAAWCLSASPRLVHNENILIFIDDVSGDLCRLGRYLRGIRRFWMYLHLRTRRESGSAFVRGQDRHHHPPSLNHSAQVLPLSGGVFGNEPFENVDQPLQSFILNTIVVSDTFDSSDPSPTQPSHRRAHLANNLRDDSASTPGRLTNNVLLRSLIEVLHADASPKRLYAC